MKRILCKPVIIPAGAFISDDPKHQPTTELQKALEYYIQKLPEDYFCAEWSLKIVDHESREFSDIHTTRFTLSDGSIVVSSLNPTDWSMENMRKNNEFVLSRAGVEQADIHAYLQANPNA